MAEQIIQPISGIKSGMVSAIRKRIVCIECPLWGR